MSWMTRLRTISWSHQTIAVAPTVILFVVFSIAVRDFMTTGNLIGLWRYALCVDVDADRLDAHRRRQLRSREPDRAQSKHRQRIARRDVQAQQRAPGRAGAGGVGYLVRHFDQRRHLGPHQGRLAAVDDDVVGEHTSVAHLRPTGAAIVASSAAFVVKRHHPVADLEVGERLVVFLIPPPDFDGDHKNLAARDADAVGDRLVKPFKPSEVHVIAQSPKTRSGRIVRRLIRRPYCRGTLVDLSSLENPQALEDIARLALRGNV
jgi:hypothetical protein